MPSASDAPVGATGASEDGDDTARQPPGRHVPGPVIGRRGSYAKGRARREEILDRALEVFRERGAAGTSLRRIAEAIGVSHGALLHYFSSREQLLLAVHQHAERRRHDDRKGEEPTGPVEGMVVAATENVQVPGLVQLYSTLLAAALEQSGAEDADDEARTYFTDRFDRLRVSLGEELAALQRQGAVRDDVPAARLAALVIAASDGLQLQWLLDPAVQLERTLQDLETLLAPRER